MYVIRRKCDFIIFPVTYILCKASIGCYYIRIKVIAFYKGLLRYYNTTLREGNKNGMESRCAITGQFIGGEIKVGK